MDAAVFLYKGIPAKVIADHPLYAVTAHGKVISYWRKTPHELRPSLNKGYPYVCLQSVDRSKSSKMLHRLIAEAFLENPEMKPYVNHKDSDRTNARLENLEWVTAQENSNHAKRAPYAQDLARKT